MAEIPNLAGIATKDLVETIGSGNFKASYINWSRTLNLLRTSAPGWLPSCVPNADGGLIHAAPVGGYLLMQFVHADGSVTPSIPQAIMDHRNNAIPLDKITARDVTDTQRRGACMAAAMTFGLAYELWAKMPLESGYSATSEAPQLDAQQGQYSPKVAVKERKPKGAASLSAEDFLAAAAKKGLCSEAQQKLLGLIKGNIAQGIKTLESKDESWVEEQNAPFAVTASGENW